MLRILGSPKQLCAGVSRREMLRAGSLALGSLGLGLGGWNDAGLTLGDLLRGQAAASEGTPANRPKTFGQAKAVILLHLYGSPSQMETFDPKPESPVEVRGELKAIESSLPGCQVCELLPNLAKVMDRTTVIRSLTHPYPLHGVAYALTGVPAIDVPMELNPHDPRHWPFCGSVVDYLETLREKQNPPKTKRQVPRNVALPFPFSSRRKGEVPRAGPYAVFLGGEYNPVWTDFVGQATRERVKSLREDTYSALDPYLGVNDEAHFEVPSASQLQPDVTLDRLNRRRSLLEQFDAGRSQMSGDKAGRQLDRYQQMAFNLLESDKLRTALDLRREPATLRDSYGRTLFGQSCLAARRMVEAGSKVVTVFWDEYELAGSGWDTHWDHFPRMKEELCPGLDQAWFGLINDLDQRGMLDDTLVICTSEHGRTPKLKTDRGGGRDHWSRVYSALMAGAGVARGRVVGASDRQGGLVADSPCSPKDMLATMYHLLGIDHHTILYDALTRPLPLVDGRLLHEVLG